MTTTGLATYLSRPTGWGGTVARYALEPAYADETHEETVYWSQIVVSAVDLPDFGSGSTCETMAFGVNGEDVDMMGLGTIRGSKDHRALLALLGYAEGITA